MLLYVLYIEPLILLLDRRLKGLVFLRSPTQSHLENFKQVTEAFCDDINLIITDDDDFKVVGDSVVEFEKVSGAILSRNKKCLVLGLGLWKNRVAWNLDYLQPVEEIKIFGIWVMNNYRQLLSVNWSRRIEKLRNSIFSWSGRHFGNIKQKVDVLNCFALSRIFYVAAVLPVTKSALRTINTLIGDFLWKKSGKVLRIPREECVNREDKGGMALLDMEAMCNSLIASQTFRLMKSNDSKSQKHLKFWMFGFLEDIWEGPFNCVTVENYECEHFNLIAGLLANVQILESVDISTWRSLTNKMIYLNFADTFVKPKVERESSWDMSLVWRRLKLMGYKRDIHEVSFLMIHNKLPLQERLFRVQLSPDPYCPSCLDAFFQDAHHYFITCERVQRYWIWVREICSQILGWKDVDDEALLKFYWPTSRRDREISWLISHYIFIVWEMLFTRRRSVISEGEFFGFLRFKYKEARTLNLISDMDSFLR